jgi:hypothetical protein
VLAAVVRDHPGVDQAVDQALEAGAAGVVVGVGALPVPQVDDDADVGVLEVWEFG